MTYRTSRKPTDGLIILEDDETKERVVVNITRRTDVSALSILDDRPHTILGYARDYYDAGRQMQENSP